MTMSPQKIWLSLTIIIMLEVDLVQVSSEMVPDNTKFPSQSSTDQTAKNLNGAFIFQMLSSKLCKIFQDYTDDVFISRSS